MVRRRSIGALERSEIHLSDTIFISVQALLKECPPSLLDVSASQHDADEDGAHDEMLDDD